MPVVRNSSGRSVYVRNVGDFDPGEEKEVEERYAEYLDENRDDFEVVEEEGEGGGGDDGDGSGDEEDEDGADEAFDADEWLDQDYRGRAERVREGEVDEVLDLVADEETSDTVIEAVEERRNEIGG
jgi:hypothetical protein